MSTRTGRGVFCGILGAVFWGVSGVCSQFLFQNYQVDSIWLTVVRMLSAGTILLAVALLTQKKKALAIFGQPKEVGHLVVFALGGLLLCQFSYLTAIQHSNSGTATVLQNLSIVMVAVLVSCKKRTMPPPVQLFSVGLALLGVFLIATQGDPRNMALSAGGLFWGIVSAVGACSYSLLSSGLVERWSSISISGYGMLIGGAVLLALTGAWGWPAGFDLRAFLLVCGIVLLGTVGAFSLFLQCIRDVGPVKATLFACIEPVTATALSAFLLGSVFTLADVIGFACILSTVFLLTLVRERAPLPKTEDQLCGTPIPIAADSDRGVGQPVE